MPQTIEQLVYEITAKNDQVIAAIKQVEGRVDGLARSAEKSQASLQGSLNKTGAAFGRLAALAGGAISVGAIKKIIDYGDRLNDLSTRLGISTEALSELGFAAKLTGVNFEGLTSAMQLAARNISDAALGTGTAANALMSLGLSATELNKISPDKQLEAIADAMQNVTNQGDKVSLAMDIFGRSGAEVIQVMDGGAKSIRALRDEAKDLGLSISTDVAQQMAKANDEMDKLTSAGQGLATTLTIALVPALADFLVGVNAAITGTENTSKFFNELRLGVLALQNAIGATNVTDEILEAEADAAFERIARGADKAAASTEKLSSKGGGLVATGKAADEAAKNAQKLADALDEMQGEAFARTQIAGMDELEAQLYDVDRAAAKLEKQYGKLSERQKEQVKATKDQVKIAYDAEKAVEAQTKAVEEAAEAQAKAAEEAQAVYDKVFENALSGLQSVITDTFEGIFDGSINSASDAADAIKKVFFNMAAQLATIEFLNLVGLPQGLSGAASGGGIASMLGFGGSSGGGGGGLGSLAQTGISKGLGLGFGSGIDAFGAAAFPSLFASGIPSLTAGAAIGAPLPAAGLLSGAGIGLSAIALPIAALAVTALISGLGSKSRPHPASTAGVSGFDESGGLVDLDIQSKHLGDEVGQQIADSIEAITRTLSSAGGLDLSVIKAPASGGTAFQAGVNDGQGFFTFGDHKADLDNAGVSVKFDPKDDKDLNRALGDLSKLFIKRVDELGGDVNENLLHAFTNIKTEGRELQEVLDDIAFAAGFDKLGEVPETMSAVAQAVKDLRDTFNTAAETAERLGLEVDKVREVEQKRFEMIRAEANAGVESSLLNLINPNGAKEVAINKQFDATAADLKLVGGNVALLEVLRKLTLEQELSTEATTIAKDETVRQTDEQIRQTIEIRRLRDDQESQARDLLGRFASVSAAFEQILFSTTLGEFSPLNPVDRLAAQRAEVQSLSSRAQLGDIDAQEKLADLLPAFLELSSSVNAFNQEYEKDRALAENSSRLAKTVADRQVEIQTSILNELQIQTELLQATASAATDNANTGGGSTTPDNSANDAIFASLNSGQQGATLLGREMGLLSSSEFAIGGLLQARLNSSGRQAEFDAARAARGFAFGGLVVGGNGGNDDIPARLSNQEFVMRSQAVRGIGASNLAYMNATGSMPSNDNGRLVNAVETLIRVTAGGARANEQLLVMANRELADMKYATQLEAAR